MTKQSLKLKQQGSAAAGMAGTGAMPAPGSSHRYDDLTVLARVAALKEMVMGDLKAQWRSLFDTEPPPYNRKYVESRLAYRVQELAFGGLKLETRARLKTLADDIEAGKTGAGRGQSEDRLVVGTRLIREWQGVEHAVTVLADGYEWQGRPYHSLSSVARAITGTRWNGWLFFGLKNGRATAKGREA